MEPNHMHSVIALFVFFAVAGLFAWATKEIGRAKRNKSKYGNVKAGDCITPRDE